MYLFMTLSNRLLLADRQRQANYFIASVFLDAIYNFHNNRFFSFIFVGTLEYRYLRYQRKENEWECNVKFFEIDIKCILNKYFIVLKIN